MSAPRVFISYNHKDKRWLDDLLTSLKPCVRNATISVWSDKEFQAGQKWFAEIQKAVNHVGAAVFLVSPDFLASDFINDRELGPLLERAEQDGVRILWIPVRPSAYKASPLKDYQALWDPDKPLATLRTRRDEAWSPSANRFGTS